MYGVGMIAFFFRWWAIHLNDLRGMGASWLVIRGSMIERLAVTGESCEIEKATYLLWDVDILCIVRGNPDDVRLYMW